MWSVLALAMLPPGMVGQGPERDWSSERLRDALGSATAADRAMAACWLGRGPDTAMRRALPALLDLLEDDTPVEGRLCREQGNWNGGDRWEDSSPGREAAMALEELGREAVDPVTAVLRSGGSAAREHAALALGLIESSLAVPALESALTDPVADVRARAAWALGMIESPDSVEPLIPLLEDRDHGVRSQAAWGLGMIESPSATEALMRALREDPNAHVRGQAAWALGMIENPQAAGALADALDDDDAGVRKQALWALTMVMDEGDLELDNSELADKLRRALRRRDAGGTD